jgi:hypothetical protein
VTAEQWHILDTRWAYMVWGSLVALVRADSTATHPANVVPELCKLVRDEADALEAIDAAVRAAKYDRVTAALARLRAIRAGT